MFHLFKDECILAGKVTCAGHWEGTAVFCCGFYTDTHTHTHHQASTEQTKRWCESKWTDVTLIDLGIRALTCLPSLLILPLFSQNHTEWSIPPAFLPFFLCLFISVPIQIALKELYRAFQKQTMSKNDDPKRGATITCRFVSVDSLAMILFEEIPNGCELVSGRYWLSLTAVLKQYHT